MHFFPDQIVGVAVLIGMTKTQANQHRRTMNAALTESLECQSLGVAAVRCCLETALAHCRALADGGMLEQRDEYEVNECRMALSSQGFEV